MSGLYPSLPKTFNSDGVCSICRLEMANIPRFSCDKQHVICQRCRAYFFNCPQCLEPLHENPPQGQVSLHQPNQQPWTLPYPPSAPSLEEFHEHERGHHSRNPQRALTNADLIECPYSHLGCTTKFVEELRDMHVSRCQYKHHHDEEQLTQVTGSCSPQHGIACRYLIHGCNVRLPHERLRNHEEICIYKNRVPSPSHHDCDSPADVVDVCCKYKSAGCNVRLPHWRLNEHEDICIYKDREPSPCVEYDRNFDWYQSSSTVSPRVTDRSCRYLSVGCNVRLPPDMLRTHEGMCIYKDRY